MGSANELDLESPGYEHLRLYQNMSNLYYKLLALNYHKEFCTLYKCRPIHKYYFSVQHENPTEQQYLFTCLCAWLIKDKCQMNLETNPEEYEDLDTTVNIIREALQLLLEPDENTKTRKEVRNSIRLPVGRLKLGFGPEAILAMNILADRALELAYESRSLGAQTREFFFFNKQASDTDSSTGELSKSITIGQPLVGGGLTTRPLGNYPVNDETLLFDDEIEEKTTEVEDKLSSINWSNPNKRADWYKQVERVAPSLISASERLCETESRANSWSIYVDQLKTARREIQEFLHQFESPLASIPSRIARQLDSIKDREKVIKTNLSSRIEGFLKVWKDYSIRHRENEILHAQVDAKMDSFEKYQIELRDMHHKIESRVKELNDGSKLKELKSKVVRMEKENADFDVKIGLLLTVYGESHSSIVKERLNEV